MTQRELSKISENCRPFLSHYMIEHIRTSEPNWILLFVSHGVCIVTDIGPGITCPSVKIFSQIQ